MGEPQQQGLRTVGAWALGSHIGAGSFAIVWRARHTQTGQEAAVKEIALSKLNAKLRQSLESEVAILKRIRHEHIVQVGPAELWHAVNSAAAARQTAPMRYGCGARTLPCTCCLHQRKLPCPPRHLYTSFLLSTLPLQLLEVIEVRASRQCRSQRAWGGPPPSLGLPAAGGAINFA